MARTLGITLLVIIILIWVTAAPHLHGVEVRHVLNNVGEAITAFGKGH